MKHVGCAIHPKWFTSTAEITPNATAEITPNDYSKCILKTFTSVVIEHHLKWAPLCEDLPGPIEKGSPSKRLGRYDFYHCDRLVDWAIENKLHIKGHVLMWHVTSPSYLSTLSDKDLKEAMRRHIYTTVGHFRGRIFDWDVVNESLAPDGSLARNLFYERFGSDYIDWCFFWAREAGGDDVNLIYNDNKVEGCGMKTTNHSRKADAFYYLVKGMCERGVPIDGVGMQAHFDCGGVGIRKCPSPKAISDQIQRFKELNLSVNLSEMDVRIANLKLPQGSSADLSKKIQRQVFERTLSACWQHENFTGVWFWGVNDASSWCHEFYKPDEPLLIDDNFKEKFGILSKLRGGSENEIEFEGEFGVVDGFRWWADEDEEEDGSKVDAINTDRPDWEI